MQSLLTFLPGVESKQFSVQGSDRQTGDGSEQAFLDLLKVAARAAEETGGAGGLRDLLRSMAPAQPLSDDAVAEASTDPEGSDGRLTSATAYLMQLIDIPQIDLSHIDIEGLEQEIGEEALAEGVAYLQQIQLALQTDPSVAESHTAQAPQGTADVAPGMEGAKGKGATPAAVGDATNNVEFASAKPVQEEAKPAHSPAHREIGKAVIPVGSTSPHAPTAAASPVDPEVPLDQLKGVEKDVGTASARLAFPGSTKGQLLAGSVIAALVGHVKAVDQEGAVRAPRVAEAASAEGAKPETSPAPSVIAPGATASAMHQDEAELQQPTPTRTTPAESASQGAAARPPEVAADPRPITVPAAEAPQISLKERAVERLQRREVRDPEATGDRSPRVPPERGAQPAQARTPSDLAPKLAQASQQPAAPKVNLQSSLLTPGAPQGLQATQEDFQSLLTKVSSNSAEASGSDPLRATAEAQRQAAAPVARQVASAIVKERPQSGGNSIKELRISLRPESLGQVDVRIEMRDDVSRAMIRTETGQAAELLRADIRTLEQALREAGYKLDGGIDVASQDEGGRGEERRPGNAHAEERGSGGQQDVDHATADEAPAIVDPDAELSVVV